MPYSQSISESYSLLEKSPYPIVKLKDLVVISKRGYIIKGINLVGDILLLTPHNLSSEGIKLNNVRYLSLDEHQKLKATQLNNGDIIVSLLERPTVATVYNLEQPANINNYLVKLQLKPKINSDYFVDYLNSEIGQFLFNSLKSGTTIPIITLTNLMKISIILPPLEKQKEIINQSKLSRA